MEENQCGGFPTALRSGRNDKLFVGFKTVAVLGCLVVVCEEGAGVEEGAVHGADPFGGFVG